MHGMRMQLTSMYLSSVQVSVELNALQPLYTHSAKLLTLCMQAKVQLPKQSETLLYLPDINAVFGLDSVEAIYEALQKRNDEWSQQTLQLLKG